jgi:hypothetical protein
MKIKVFGLVVVSQCVSKHSIFLPEDREQIWREINRPLTSKPAAVLEGRCTSISNRYCCCCRKKFLVRFVHGISDPIHSLSCSFHSCHSHRNLRLLAKRLILRIPRPPKQVGRAEWTHFTLHFPPVIAAASTKQIFSL